ncbi:MAG TPA: phosphatidylserine decarboxylase family protein [Candidatus Saccharimonadia bacterium]|nr:phosphatidylserine decarboxylase family protein [Candidatus Saccharimonadia bacterium]
MTIWLYRRVRVASEGWVFVLPLAGATLLSALVGWWGVTGVGLVLTVGVALFFRDPERIIPQTPETIVSPADGRVMEIVPENTQTRRISIFLSLWDVHINRAPYGGVVRSVVYTPGEFLAAYRQEASLVNEANTVTIAEHGREFIVKQIAGVLARRIVCRVRPGDTLEKGQRYGLIRFGSRTDLLLPATAEIAVQVGDVVRGGETILAFLKEPPGA